MTSQPTCKLLANHVHSHIIFPMFRTFPFFFIACLLSLSADAAAPPDSALTLPYSQRTHPFNGLSGTVRGDIRTVGMAGATAGLADTFIAAIDNPAGLAMTMNTGDFNAASNWIRDSRLQLWNNPVQSTSFGAAATPYPWGFSLGYFTPYSEGQGYILPSTSSLAGQTIYAYIDIREYRFSLARVFFDDRLSVGASLGIGHAVTRYHVGDTLSMGGAQEETVLRPTLGLLYQLPRRVMIGVSYSFPAIYDGNPSADTLGLDHFFQPIHVPGRLALGAGWIPNRFFRCDLSLFIFGSTPSTALLRSDFTAIGKFNTLQPRAGVSYDFLELNNLKATAFGGTYYEPNRIDDESDRWHWTGGIEAKPWVLTLGTGVDWAPGYRNFIVSTGLDVIRLMQKTDLVPTPSALPLGGFLPRPTGFTNEGLARPLARGWRPVGGDIDPIQAGMAIPAQLQKKVREAGAEISDFFDESEAPKALPKKKKKK